MGLAWSEAGQGAEAVGRPGSQPRIASVAPVQPQARHLHLQVSASLRGLMSPTLLFKTRDLSSHSREVLGLGFWFSLYLCPGSRCSPLWASEKGRWPAGCPVWCSCHPGMSASFLAHCKAACLWGCSCRATSFSSSITDADISGSCQGAGT